KDKPEGRGKLARQAAKLSFFGRCADILHGALPAGCPYPTEIGVRFISFIIIYYSASVKEFSEFPEFSMR
ncbi:MAG TPA: hypothetical protein DDY70_02935, partial [Clostridiales bacterium]|nr:hypothetical protein [Clostridiales bacterium]